jgi:hypothetical protein
MSDTEELAQLRRDVAAWKLLLRGFIATGSQDLEAMQARLAEDEAKIAELERA